MQKIVIFSILALLFFPLVLAADLEVEILEEEPIIIVEKDNVANFTLLIKSNELDSDLYEIYSLVGISITPEEFFTIPSNETIELQIVADPHDETIRDFRGFYVFEYQIKGLQTGFFTDRLTINILELKDVLSLDFENINIEDSQTQLTVKNLEDLSFENIEVKAESLFFDFSETFNLSENEEKSFTIPIDEESIKRLSAGDYEVSVALSLNNIETEQAFSIKYLEEGSISVFEETSGALVKKTTLTKTNEGNIKSTATITDRKDALSRLFTTYSQTPQTSERNGFFVELSWEKELTPGESYSITTTTNYTFPFILIIIIIVLIIIIKIALLKELSIDKKATLMPTKGGEFALKIKLRVKSRKHLNNIKIVDTLPRLTKLYEKFGTKPDKIDPKTRRILWHLNSLNAGEERVFTYIMYSKVNVLGKFELPAARASYEKKGKSFHTYSNKAYFAMETSEDKTEEQN